MMGRPPVSTRMITLFPFTALFRALRLGSEVGAEDGIGIRLLPHCGVVRVDRLAAMLPDIADGGGEHDIAARRARVARDIFHLVEEDLLRVDRKYGFALVAEIDVILRVGYHRAG